MREMTKFAGVTAVAAMALMAAGPAQAQLKHYDSNNGVSGRIRRRTGSSATRPSSRRG